MRKIYDVLVIGPVSLEHNIDYQGNERKEVGGAGVASGFAAARSGNRTAVFTKLSPADADVEVHLKAEPVTVQGNETLLKQMIYNLVENAIRYNREGGHVLVEVCEEDVPADEGASGEGGVRIGIVRVNDTGAGIPADKLEKIFERFYRLEKSRSKELGGTGLGLAIVKHAALYHGGEVFVESEEDVGTRFTVRLPIG